ncbi:MAG: tetratricopeptide repeat protein [Pseudonocardiaceae bacterium]
MTDVQRIEDANRAFRAVDYRYGGGACHDAVVSYLPWGLGMLGAYATDLVTDRLCVAVADLHNLAGWTSFDTGRVRVARSHFGHALELAKQGHDDALVANILYRMGRVHLHHNALDEALREFQLGQVAAQVAGSALAVAILYANQAWASAKMGLDDEALALLGRSRDEFARADPAGAPVWARFFTETDMSAMAGTVYTELALTVAPTYTRSAIPALSRAIDGYSQDMTRSRSFNLIMLATNHLLEDDIDHAATVGVQAVALAESVKTARTKDRLRPLKREADKRRDSADASALSERIATFTATEAGCCWTSAARPPQPCTSSCGSPCERVWRPPIPPVQAA